MSSKKQEPIYSKARKGPPGAPIGKSYDCVHADEPRCSHRRCIWNRCECDCHMGHVYVRGRWTDTAA